MVALTTSTLNESYVEPSPYAWLRSRAPVPTSYAPVCSPLYPFQEILENRTSRARGRTGYCAEVVERKYLICIEIWQFELESCVWRVSFHKYAYVHGDPVNAIDPTGMFWQSLYLRVKDAAASLGAKYAIEATLKEIGKRYAWKLAQNFVEWYYIDNHINGTIDALAGFAYEVSGMQDKNVAAVVGRLNAILGTLTAMRRVMKTSPLLLVPLLSANPSFKGSKLEGLVNFYSGWQSKSRIDGRVAGGLMALGAMPLLIANLNYANTFNNANNAQLKFTGVISPMTMVGRLLLGSAMGTTGQKAFVSTVWLPDIIRSARDKVRASPNPQSFANAVDFMVREIQEAFPVELDFVGDEEDE